MKIERIINGETVEIELTGIELLYAYEEQRRNYQKEDVLSVLEMEREEVPEQVLDALVNRSLEYMGENVGWHDAVIMAVNFYKFHDDYNKFVIDWLKENA